MQQTKLDRWLQNTFVNETLIMTVREPPIVPKGIKLLELPQKINNNFRYQMVVRKQEDVDAILAALKEKSQTFTTRVQHRRGLAARYFSNPNGKSFSITLLAAILGAALVFTVVILFPDILIEYFHEYVTPLGGKLKDTAVETWQDFFGSVDSRASEPICQSGPQK